MNYLHPNPCNNKKSDPEPKLKVTFLLLTFYFLLLPFLSSNLLFASHHIHHSHRSDLHDGIHIVTCLQDMHRRAHAKQDWANRFGIAETSQNLYAIFADSSDGKTNTFASFTALNG